MKLILVIGLWLPTVLAARDYTFTGPWVTTNRPLDGIMTAVLTPTANDQWRGKFFGHWQGVDFSYPVEFSGPLDALQGTTIVDGTPYQWKGWINKDELVGNFSGLYQGSFRMARVRPPDASMRFHQGRWWYQHKDKRWSYWTGEKWLPFRAGPNENQYGQKDR